jgi:ATP-dependent Clp protease adaptor protein ClpS
MNPYPFASLNHLTVPVAIQLVPYKNVDVRSRGPTTGGKHTLRRWMAWYGDKPELQLPSAKRPFLYAQILPGATDYGRKAAVLEKTVAIIKHSPHLGVLPGVFPRSMAVHEQRGDLLEAEKSKLKPPPLYKVLLLNDDYTPMDFVVVVLQTVFGMSREKATRVMLQVHREGMGVCGTYTREVAAAKVDQVINIARKHQHPLQCTMEEI